MMKNKIILLLLITFFILSNLTSKEPESLPPPIPNPLELTKDSWDYFNVPDESLPEKIEQFKGKLNNLIANFSQEEHKQIHDQAKQTVLELEAWAKKKNQLFVEEVAPIQLLKKYTTEQLFEVNANILKTENEIAQTKDKVVSKKILLNRAQSNLDRSILDYQAHPAASFEKLLLGLNVIEARAEQAFYKAEIEFYKKKENWLLENKKLLTDELNTAKKRISYKDVKLENLNQALSESQKQINTETDKLNQLERENLQKEKPSEIVCCLENYKLLSQRITVENLYLISTINQIKVALFQIKNKTDLETSSFQKMQSKWVKTISDAQELLVHWQKSLEDDAEYVNRLIVQMVKDEQAPNLNELHLELANSFGLLDDVKKNIAHAQLLNTVAEDNFVKKQGITETITRGSKLRFYEALNKAKELMSATIFRIKGEPVTLEVILKAVIAIGTAFIFSRYLQKFLVKKKIIVKTFSASTEYIVLRFINYAIIIIGFIVAFGLFGLDLTNLAIIAGALGVGIGFGLQSMVTNIIAGFSLLLNKYLKVGDLIELKGEVSGRVTEINLQNTQIETFDGANVIIPNSHLTTQHFINWTMFSYCRRFKVAFSLPTGADKDLIKSKVLDKIKTLPYVISESKKYSSPQIWFKEYSSGMINFDLVVWVDLKAGFPQGTPGSSLMWEVDNVLNDSGITIPHTQYDIHLVSDSKEDIKS